MLRLAQPVAPRLPNALDLSGWMNRAGDVLMQVTGPLATFTSTRGAR